MLGFEVTRLKDVVGRDCASDEVALIVADYLGLYAVSSGS
jgi:hypothetical protein